MKLVKFLAEHNVDARRKCAEIISQGRISINNKIIKNPMAVITENDVVKLDGKIVKTFPQKNGIYVMFYKPVGCITSVSDEKERTTVIDFMKKIKGWKTLHPVGRLDFNTEGLLLLTNDGDYTQSILHPSKKILKTYLAKIKGQPEFTKLKRLLTGVRIKGKLIKCEKIRLKKKLKTNSWVEIKLYSGQNRIVRNLFDAIQCPVIKLTRLAIGNLSLKNYTLIPGKYILLDNTKKNLVFEEN